MNFDPEIESSILWVDPISLKESDNNPNKHSNDQLDRMAKLIEHYGWRHPIIIRKETGKVIAGHGRLRCAIQKKWDKVPIQVQSFKSDEDAYGFMVADNSIASWADLDLASINLEVPDLGPDFDIDLLGIKDFSIEPADKYSDKEEDDVQQSRSTDIRHGDFFSLGAHRLLCGDSTKSQEVQKLITGKLPQICFTSPPYNLGNNAKLRGHNADGDDSVYLSKSDHKSSDDYFKFLMNFTNEVLSISEVAFINIQLLAGNKLSLPRYLSFFHEFLIDIIIWDKEFGAPAMAPNVLNSAFEFIFIFSRDKYPTRSLNLGAEFRGTIPNIYRLNPRRGPKEESAADHGAVFPVQFAEYFIKNFSRGNVYEPFCGSGTTLIAAEKLGRQCYAMELDPLYCQTTIDRFEKFTGIKAVKL